MYSIKKKVASIALAGTIVFGGMFSGQALNPLNFLSFKPVTVSAETEQFKIGDITYKIYNDTGVSVIGCDLKSSISIPSVVSYGGKTYQVVEIDEPAFKNNTVVTSIAIPDYVYYVNPGTFVGCNNLSVISVSMYNQYYTSYNGVLYNQNMDELIKYPPKKTATYYNAPYGLLSVAGGAFANCTYLERIYLSDNLIYVSDGALSGCSKLNEINVTTANTNLCSVDGVLYSKDKKVLVKYPGGKTNTTFTIIPEVEEVYEEAFVDGLKLTSFYVATGNYNFNTFEGVLFSFYNSTLICYPAGKTNTIYSVPSTVKSIPRFAFKNTKVTDIRNLDKRIDINDYCSNFIYNSNISKINGSSSLTSSNKSFIYANINELQRSSIVINAVKNKINEAKAYLYNTYPNPTTFQKIKGMHDWLCNNTEYVPDAQTAYGVQLFDNYGNPLPQNIPSQSTQNAYKYSYFIQTGVSQDNMFGSGNYYVDDITDQKYHCASGALLLPTTVCEGYSKAYHLLLKSVSVDCEMVGNINHGWNVVKINGKYYQVDCCHDDNGIIDYNYSHFLKTNDYLVQNCSLHNYYALREGDDEFNLLFKNVLGYPITFNTDEYIKTNAATSNYVW